MEKLIEHKLVHTGSILKVYADIIEFNNQQYKRDFISHNGGVGVIAIKDNSILLVKQYRHCLKFDTIEIPAGKIDHNEDINLCAKRELEEECALKAEQLKYIFKMHPCVGYSNECLYLFEATNLTVIENPTPCDEDEDITCFYMPITDAIQAIKDKKITDAKTMFAIYYAYSNLVL